MNKAQLEARKKKLEKRFQEDFKMKDWDEERST